MTDLSTQPTEMHVIPASGDRLYGAVKWFDAKKGFGFIVPDIGGKDVFFHQSDVKKSKIDGELGEGDAISFDVAPTPRGVKAVGMKREG